MSFYTRDGSLLALLAPSRSASFTLGCCYSTGSGWIHISGKAKHLFLYWHNCTFQTINRWLSFIDFFTCIVLSPLVSPIGMAPPSTATMSGLPFPFLKKSFWPSYVYLPSTPRSITPKTKNAKNPSLAIPLHCSYDTLCRKDPKASCQ